MSSGERSGAYTAERAAALSGVPRSTVHYWARKEILVPSVSAERVKLWSYADLLGLRTIYWLRQTKTESDGRQVPRTAMPAVRRSLDALRAYNLEIWSDEGAPRIAVDRAGRVFLRTDGADVQTVDGARPLAADWLDLIEPFTTRERTHGPDLQAPRPSLRIIPGKLAGSPHIARTRIETVAIAAVADRGVGEQAIHSLYPSIAPAAIAEAIELEAQLRDNLRAAA
jgi:uncharacterized protein (DUF433 family)